MTLLISLLGLIGFLAITCYTTQSRGTSEMAKVLHRPIRSLSFPDSSNMAMFLALAIPLEDPLNAVSFSYFFEADYALPVNYSLHEGMGASTTESTESSTTSATTASSTTSATTKSTTSATSASTTSATSASTTSATTTSTTSATSASTTSATSASTTSATTTSTTSATSASTTSSTTESATSSTNSRNSKSNSRRRRSIDRSTVYTVLSNKFESAGFPGHECLLRSICEASEYPLKHNGVLGDVFHVIFTPSSSRAEKHLPDGIVEAELKGRSGICIDYYSLCSLSLFDLIGVLL